MSDILERAKSHYQGKPPHDIKIPEWGTPGNPAVITWTDLTVHDQDRIYAPENGRTPAGGTIRVRAVILKACDAEGRRLFDGMAEHDLRHAVDGDIVGRIANAILYGAGVIDAAGETKPAEDQVDAAKNG
jgi:hypothetical protein